MGKRLELAIGVLNGAVGDWLSRTSNGLATPMEVVREGRSVAVERESLGRAFPAATSRIALLVHGLMCTESVWDFPDGTDYGSLLERDLGMTPVFLRYNTGLPIPDNGALLHELLSALVAAWPVELEEVVLIGYSMGGLVVRSATHCGAVASAPWLDTVQRAIYVGTPHLGAPLERVGRVVTRVLEAIDDPVTKLLADVARGRSAGLQDLGDADLRHEDRARRTGGLGIRDARHPVPLLDRIDHHLVAASLSLDPRLASLFGDVLVPVPSGTDGRCVCASTIALPPERVAVIGGMGHIALAHDARVYEHILRWCSA